MHTATVAAQAGQTESVAHCNGEGESMAQVVALVARKGGAGKTSIAASLAAISVSKALHTATVDLDSQANLSHWALGQEALGQLGSLNTVAALEYPPPQLARDDFPALRAVETRKQLLEVVAPLCIHPVEHIPGLSIIPTANHIHAETARDLVLSDLPFDVVFVDTPPDISTYAVRSVLRQADLVISPVVCEPWAVDSIAALVKELRSVGRSDLVQSGGVRWVVNMRQRCALHDTLEKNIRKVWGPHISRVVIPRSVAIAEASLDPRVLTKKHPLWKAGLAIWKELETLAKKRSEVAA